MAAGELPYMHSPVVGIQSFLTVALRVDWGIVFPEDRNVYSFNKSLSTSIAATINYTS